MKRFLLFIVFLVTVSTFFYGSVMAGMFGGRASKTETAGIPTGAALWEQLKQMNYTNKFKMWPGKTNFYPGSEPHGALLTTYVNIPAFMGIAGKKGTLPEGSLIVKENYLPDKKLSAITVMYKIRGYNPEGGDWFWAKYAPDGKVESEGKVEVCIKCHGNKKDNDYIMTSPLK
jgi:hypothetical protein